MSFFRYPGGKSKLCRALCVNLHTQIAADTDEYREPFFGGGSLLDCLRIMRGTIDKIWINDKDRALADLWTSVIRYPKPLQKKVAEFSPSTEAFYNFKKKLTANKSHSDTQRSIVQHGFMKLAIHQISYSGLGTKSGGPLGGREQASKYKVDCRWSPSYINRQIQEHHELFSRFQVREDRCTSYDFQELLDEDCSKRMLVYLDPPYYVQGNSLYEEQFSEDDHRRLAKCLKSAKFRWTLSYDKCPEVMSLYEDWASIEKLDVTYSIVTKKSASPRVELMIHNGGKKKKKVGRLR